MITKTTIDRVFETARVEEVIGEFVQLKKSGSSYKGLSPFSQERTPSFMVSPVKQIWKDFSSGKGGSVVSFLMEHEHYTYPEAIKWLAKKYNIEIEETQQSDADKEQDNERESLFLVSKFAKDYFQQILVENDKGKAIGLSYFKERGFTDETIQKFDLGYCLDEWDEFTKAALAKGYQLQYLEQTGLTIVKDDKQFDRFKGRVMFPIHSMSGRILGFGGRILDNTKKVAKYVNSPESEIYQKSKVLYGIYQAKKEISKQDNCYLVEGYTDVISFHQTGIENVVASSGTALTPDQIRLIKRLTNNITILFDGDDAGIRASLRGIDLILEQGLNVKVVQFPAGDDPDSFAKRNSLRDLQGFLQTNQKDFITYKVSLLIDEAKNDPIKKAGLIRDIIQSIAKIPDAIKREIYIRECSSLMDITEKVLHKELAQMISKNSRNEQPQNQEEQQPLEVVKSEFYQVEDINQLSILEREIIRILLLFGDKKTVFLEEITQIDEHGKETKIKNPYESTVCEEIYLQLQEDEIEFTNPIFQEIYAEIIHQLNQDEKLDITKLINTSNTTFNQVVTSILMDEEKYQLSNWETKNIYVTSKTDVLPKLVKDAIFNIRRILIDKKIQEITKETNQEVDLELVKNYIDLKKRLFIQLNRVV